MRPALNRPLSLNNKCLRARPLTLDSDIFHMVPIIQTKRYEQAKGCGLLTPTRDGHDLALGFAPSGPSFG